MQPRLLLLNFAWLFLTCFDAKGQQSAYHDAIFLSTNCIQPAEGITRPKFKNQNDVYLIMQKYYPGLSDAEMDSAINANPFYGQYFPDGGWQQSPPAAIFTDLASKIGGVDVTNFADGLAKFLAERTKEEMNIAFFDRFRDLLNKYPEIKVLFPKTSRYLNAIMNHEYANILTALREAFESDLKNLPADIIALSELNASEACANAGGDIQKCKKRIELIQNQFKTNAGAAAIASLSIADGIIGSSNAVNILHSIAVNKTIQSSKNELPNAIKLADIISQSLLSNKPNEMWVPAAELLNELRNAVFQNIYLGLVYQQILNAEITFNKGTTNFSTQLTTANAAGIVQYIQEIQVHILDIEASSKNLKKNTGEVDVDKLSALLSAVSATLTASSHLHLITPAIPAKVIADINTGVSAANNGIVIAQNIIAKNYAAAVMNSIVLISDISEIALQKRGQYSKALNANRKWKTKGADGGAEAWIDFKQRFAKYGTFIAAASAAKTSDEIKSAIKAVALPPGSSAIKKNTNFSIALQAYVGIAAGKESIKSDNIFNALSVYVPVGVSFNVGLKSWRNTANKINGGSLSVSASLVDIGAMVAYRFKNPADTLSAEVKVRFENIFAPGVNLVYGFPKIPLSIGGGIQWQPSLTSFSKDKLTIGQQSGYRAQLFLAFDLPILNIYTTRK